MKTFFLLIAVTIGLSCFAQKQIKLEEAKDHIGDSVKLEGIVSGARVFEDDDKKPTLSLISLGGEYPNQLLTIAVQPSYKTNGVEFPDNRLKGSRIVVTGKLELYKGKPQIVVRSFEQLHIMALMP
jgi:hypothetical protein